MILFQLQQDFRQIFLCHKLVYIVRAIENCVNEIALAYLLFQNIIQRIREKEFIGGCTVIKRNIVTAAAEFVIAFSALPVGVQLVPPSNHILKIPLCSGSILQTGKCFCPQFPFQLFAFWFLVPGIVLKGMFCGIGFQSVYDILLQSDLPLCLFRCISFCFLRVAFVAAVLGIFLLSLPFRFVGRIVYLGIHGIFVVPEGVFIFFLVIIYVLKIVGFIFISVIILKHRRHLPSKIFLKFSAILRKNSSAKHPIFLLLVRE